ncbi:S8 family serine peptidase [Paenibacillus sp. BR2-3]|uniref:S8 family serine peptidase n=1 Tax=Paenibacillus sp. BR2-3 TaxID=3048494 RepID=UPI003977B339
MSIRKKISRLTAAAVAFTILVNSQMVYAVDDQTVTEQEVIVVYKNEEGKDLIYEESVEIEHEFKTIPAISATVTNDDLYKMVKDPNIAYIERNISFQMTEESFSAASDLVPAEQAQWNFQAVGPTTMWNAGYTGANIKVAVLDSGIFAHSELNIAGGISTVDYTNSYSDDNGHGTHVAGIISARNDGIGLVGVAPGVQLYAVKALNQDGVGNLTDILEGLDWAINNGMDIINLSLGTEEDSLAMQQMVDRAYDEGILVVASAGNSQEGIPLSINTVNYPAKYDSVIAVAAIDSANTRGSFSSVGDEVEVAAPGVNIISTYVKADGTEGYAMTSGTSQAAPHVSGTLALLKQKYPSMTNAQLREEMRKYAVDLGAPGRDSEFGFGALTFNEQADTTAPGDVTDLQVTDKTESSLSLIWSNPIDPDFATNHIYINNVRAGMTAEQTYMLDGLQPSTSYTLAVKSVDQSGNESLGITVTEATYAAAPVIDTTSPAEVTGLIANETTRSSIRLSWNNPADADFAKANVYVNGILAGESPNPSFDLTDLLPDTAYNIVVKTVDDSSNISVGAALTARTQAIPILPVPAQINPVATNPLLPNPIVSNPVGSIPIGDVIVVPTNPTPSPTGVSAVISAPPVVEKKEARAVESALEKAKESHSISDFVQAKLEVLALTDKEQHKEFQGKLEELKSVLGIKDLPAKNEIRSAVPIGINLQVAMKSASFKYIDASSIKLGVNVFVLNSKGEPVEGVSIRVVFNRILVTPGKGSFPSKETFTILIDKSVKGKPNLNSGAAFELKNPLILEFTTR